VGSALSGASKELTNDLQRNKVFFFFFFFFSGVSPRWGTLLLIHRWWIGRTRELVVAGMRYGLGTDPERLRASIVSIHNIKRPGFDLRKGISYHDVLLCFGWVAKGKLVPYLVV
jgi:hypothetical protein